MLCRISKKKFPCKQSETYQKNVCWENQATCIQMMKSSKMKDLCPVSHIYLDICHYIDNFWVFEFLVRSGDALQDFQKKISCKQSENCKKNICWENQATCIQMIESSKMENLCPISHIYLDILPLYWQFLSFRVLVRSGISLCQIGSQTGVAELENVGWRFIVLLLVQDRWSRFVWNSQEAVLLCLLCTKRLCGKQVYKNDNWDARAHECRTKTSRYRSKTRPRFPTAISQRVKIGLWPRFTR